MRLIHAALLALALVGCAGPRAKQGDLSIPVAPNQVTLAIPILNGSVQFDRPAGWRVAGGMGWAGTFDLTNAHDDSRLDVWCETAPVTSETDQTDLHSKRLKEIRSDWPSTGSMLDQKSSWTSRTASGREVYVYDYLGNDGQQLVAIIPEQGFKTTITLHVLTAEEIAAHRKAFISVVKSYRTKQ